MAPLTKLWSDRRFSWAPPFSTVVPQCPLLTRCPCSCHRPLRDQLSASAPGSDRASSAHSRSSTQSGAERR